MIRMNVYEIETKLNWPPEVIDALRVDRIFATGTDGIGT
jgi:hypothetical protein